MSDKGCRPWSDDTDFLRLSVRKHVNTVYQGYHVQIQIDIVLNMRPRSTVILRKRF